MVASGREPTSIGNSRLHQADYQTNIGCLGMLLPSGRSRASPQSWPESDLLPARGSNENKRRTIWRGRPFSPALPGEGCSPLEGTGRR